MSPVVIRQMGTVIWSVFCRDVEALKVLEQHRSEMKFQDDNARDAVSYRDQTISDLNIEFEALKKQCVLIDELLWLRSSK